MPKSSSFQSLYFAEPAKSKAFPAKLIVEVYQQCSTVDLAPIGQLPARQNHFR
jgi:hypothetical protein